MTRVSVVTAGVLMALGLARVAGADDTKIGYVDVQRAIMETNEGVSAKKKLKSMFDTKQKELDEKQEELKRLKGELDKQRTLLKQDVLAQREKDLQQKFVQLQDTYMWLQKELAERETTMMKPILDRLNGIIGGIAQRDNFTMVLEKNQSSILYARPQFDLTNEVIRSYNTGGGPQKTSSAGPKK